MYSFEGRGGGDLEINGIGDDQLARSWRSRLLRSEQGA